MIKLFTIILLLSIILVVFIGYGKYIEVKNKISIESKVAELQNVYSYTRLENISPYLIQATISIEDHRFYQHHGLDFISLGRAFLSNLLANGVVGGGSTITQQLAKNMFYSYDVSYVRKIAEMFTTLDLEKTLEKNEILELYVNIINYGDNYMGIYEASIGYFNKLPSELTLSEASLLAGIPQSPLNYQLSNHLSEAKYRQKMVLKAMLRDGWISEEEMKEVFNNN